MFLAIIPIVFGWIMVKNKNLLIKIISVSIWFFFLPNTVYLITDIVNFPMDVQKISGFYLGVDFALYLILMGLGIVTFILALEPFERMLFGKKSNKKIEQNMPVIYILNFLVGFGVVLGRVHRANSWEVFTNTQKITLDSLNTIKSWELMVLVVAFAVLSQAIYIKFRKSVLKLAR